MKVPLTSFSSIGPEFGRLKSLREIYLHDKSLNFVEKAYLSLRKKGKFEKRDIYKRSLLHYAAIGDCTQLLQYLLQAEQKIDIRDMYGRTPLSWAAEYGSLAAVKILLERGAEINAKDYEDSTPLGWLVHAGNPDNNIAATEAYMRERGAKEN